MPGLSGISPPPSLPPGPPPLGVQLAAGLHGAFLLARGRQEGLGFALLSPEGAARSFVAALLCLPFYLSLRVIGDEGVGPSLHALLMDALSYAIGWAAFPLISLGLARALGREGRWTLFIANWNWSSFVQYAALLLAALLPPGPFGAVAGLVALGYALWLGWFVSTRALGIGAVQGVGVVLLDLLLGAVIVEAARAVSGA